MSTIVHTLHVILAGTWIGGVVFTTLVVSPALSYEMGRGRAGLEAEEEVWRTSKHTGSWRSSGNGTLYDWQELFGMA